MEELFTSSLVTPRGILFKEKTSEVSVPGISGEYGILCGHKDFLGLLGIGLLRLLCSKKREISFVVQGGVFDVKDGNLTVIASRVLKSDEIEENEAALKSQYEKVTKELSEVQVLDEQFESLIKKRDLILAKMAKIQG